jgi:alanine dehydrogenase
MPGAVPRTSTFALTNATTSFILAIADKGWRQALHDDLDLRNGVPLPTARRCNPARVQSVC